MIDHISYSSWQLFRNGCQWRWKLDYIDGIRKKSQSVHLAFGTAIHSAIEKYKNKSNPVSLDESGAYFLSAFDKICEDEKDALGKFDKEFFRNAGLEIICDLESCKEFVDGFPMYNEFELFEDILIPDVSVKFKGFIDIVLKTKDKRGNTILFVSDFKTCSWGWNAEKKQDKDLHSQLFLYKHFLCKKFDVDPNLVRTSFILLKKKPSSGSSRIEWFPISAGPVSVQRALDNLCSDISKIKLCCDNNNFEKDRKLCCNKFGDTCPYFKTEYCKENS
jgi:hypothetical protein